MTPDVSVITPVYNTEDYLHQCIYSVLKEDAVGIELILVNDGSTDNSDKILRHYQDRDDRVTVVNKKNQGQGIARNVGIERARGKYLYFLDSDDYMADRSLRILFETAESKHLDLCAPASPGHYYERPLELVCCLPTRMQFVRRELVERYNVRQPDVVSGQDGVFGHLLLTHCRRFGVANRAVCHYRPDRPGSTFAKYRGAPQLVFDIIRKHFHHIDEHYEAHDLWPSQAIRLLTFIADETMKNRVGVHFRGIDPQGRLEIFEFLSGVARKAFDHLPGRFKGHLHPAVAALIYRSPERALEAFASHYLAGLLEQPIPQNFNAHLRDEAVYICKPAWRPTARNSDYLKSLDRRSSNTGDRVRAVENKLDFAINTLVNTQAEGRDVYGHRATTFSGEDSIVVSMTTLPSRLATVHLAIEAVFAQSLSPGAVVLWLDERAEFDLGQYPRLQRATENGLEICYVSDVGPHTKLVYAAQRYPNSRIVTLDDDMIYPSTTLGVLDQFSKQFPNMVIANWARELVLDERGMIQGTRKGRLLTPTSLEKEIEQEAEFAARPSYRAFAYGTSGVLYPPGSLHDTAFEFDLMRELCPKEDDIWFKAMTLLTKTAVVPTSLGINPRHYTVLGSQGVALRHVNHAGGGNLVQMRNVFRFFDLYSMMSDDAEAELVRQLDHPWS